MTAQSDSPPDSTDQNSPSGDAYLLAALRSGDETAFARLVETYYAPMLRLALVYVSDRRLAEEVIQDTWIGVLRGLNRFEGRSSLKTWIFSILINRAKTSTRHEDRYVQFSALADEDTGDDEPVVARDRFYPPDHQLAGHWMSLPYSWENIPEERLLSRETREHIRQAIDMLPPQSARSDHAARR